MMPGSQVMILIKKNNEVKDYDKARKLFDLDHDPKGHKPLRKFDDSNEFNHGSDTKPSWNDEVKEKIGRWISPGPMILLVTTLK